MIYFDSAATTLQKPESVYAAVQRTMRACASVGRGGHAAADAAARAAYACRTEAAELFDAVPEQVVFTMNATHGLNIALRSLVRPGGRVVLSGMEHNAVTRPLAALGAQIETADAPPFAPEQLLEGFARALRQGADAAVCTHVSNVYGNVLPVSAVAALCRERGVTLACVTHDADLADRFDRRLCLAAGRLVSGGDAYPPAPSSAKGSAERGED